LIDENLRINEELADAKVLINQLSTELENVHATLENENEKNKNLAQSEEILKKKLEEATLDFSKANYRAIQAERENKAIKEEFYETNMNTTHQSEILLTE
jgi:hypothetical protein